MRIAALLVSLILVPAAHLFAGPVVFLEFLNSDFTFGAVNPDQGGFDLSSFAVDGTAPDLDGWHSFYQAQAGALDHQSLDVNGSGDVIGSHYFYAGGTFEMTLFLEKDGQTLIGSFVAPIKTLVVSAGEGDGDPAQASYVLGRGLLDKAIAAALGIGRHTTGGEAVSQLILTDDGNRSGVAGDHTTPERQAWDGVTDITLNVPEPATLALFGAATALWVRRRVRR